MFASEHPLLPPFSIRYSFLLYEQEEGQRKICEDQGNSESKIDIDIDMGWV